MLQPKRTKFRKAFKGRIHGKSTSCNTLDFGAFGLKAVEPDRLTARQIEAARRAERRQTSEAWTALAVEAARRSISFSASDSSPSSFARC